MHKTISALIATLTAATACAANSFTWPQLPEGTLPDTEVSTNVVLHINSQKLDRFRKLKPDVFKKIPLRIRAANICCHQVKFHAG